MLRLLIIILFTGVSLLASGQNHFPKGRVSFERPIKGDFSFSRNWAYPCCVFLTDSGIRYTRDAQLAAPVDTVHLYYTACVLSNTKMDDSLVYAFADRYGDTLLLSFQSVTPSLGPTFIVCFVKDSFWISSIELPVRQHQRAAYSYQITKQALWVERPIKQGFPLRGRLDISFKQTYHRVNDSDRVREFYFKGPFQTSLLYGTAANMGCCAMAGRSQ
jgi:hypothetical protein